MATRRNNTWVFTVGVALLTCVSCGTGNTTERMSVRILSLNGDSVQGGIVVTHDGDQDDQTPGVQVEILVRVDGLQGASSVWLRVGERQVEAAASPDGEVAFADVTLPPGLNLIEVGCEGCNSAKLDAEVTAPTLDISELVATTITEYSHDTDSFTPGIQAQFLIRAHYVPDGVELAVQVGEHVHLVAVENRRALLEVSLPEGSFEAPVLAQAMVGDRIISSSGTLFVQGAPCEIVSIGGEPTAALADDDQDLWFGLAQDQSEIAGLQSSFVIHVGGLPGTAVELLVDGEVLVEAVQDESAMVSFPEVTLDSDATLQTRCRLAGAPDVDGESFRTYVDLDPPTAVSDLQCSQESIGYVCSWTSPVDPGRSSAVSALELRYAAGDGLCAGSYADATPLSSMPYPGMPGQQDQVAFQILDPSMNTVSLALVSWDHAGNRSAVSNIYTLVVE